MRDLLVQHYQREEQGDEVADEGQLVGVAEGGGRGGAFLAELDHVPHLVLA